MKKIILMSLVIATFVGCGKKYDYKGNYTEGLAKVSLAGKYGFIDEEGNEVIPMIYTDAHDFFDGLAFVKLNDKSGFIDKSGAEIIPIGSITYYDKHNVSFYYPNDWEINELSIPNYFDDITISRGESSIDVVVAPRKYAFSESNTISRGLLSGFEMAGLKVTTGEIKEGMQYGKYNVTTFDFTLSRPNLKEKSFGKMHMLTETENTIFVFSQAPEKEYANNESLFKIIEQTLNAN